ncbi:cuticle protein 18.6-like [Melanaphis sacchari]|uniref:cuticle protein 18.6-like n=1 Tax=Melanaphis sacchari TaxID=742174 RepID=UPI000DC14A0A|nr:cuticle protein 18.6-like [Melanaphis sacchari]
MDAKLIVFTVCMASALAQYSAPAYRSVYSAPIYSVQRAYAPEPTYAPAPYKFEYSVNDPSTYDVKSQSEYADGNGNIKGSYSLLEADGSTRVVEYTADDQSGFNAIVKKIEGGYKTPYNAPAYKPVYPAPAYKPVPYKAY